MTTDKDQKLEDDAVEITSAACIQLPPPRPPSPSIPCISKDDPGLWPAVLNSAILQYLIENPPKQVRNYDYPRDTSNRRFSDYYYDRRLGNGEKYHREWLLYSISKNAVFCLCCKLFDSKYNKFCEGISDWQHLAL
jgi:hypothetical protein